MDTEEMIMDKLENWDGEMDIIHHILFRNINSSETKRKKLYKQFKLY